MLPAWGALRIDKISKRHVIELLNSIVDRAPIKARRVHAYLSRFFKWCLKRDLITVNPMAGLERPGAETSRDRVLSDDELGRVWNAAGELQSFGPAIRLLILTGARREEIGKLKWSEIEGDTIKLSNGVAPRPACRITIPLSTSSASRY